MRLFRTLKRLFYKYLPLGHHHCAACNCRVWRFLPYRGGKASPFLVALDVVGSDIINFECPSCGATDRERHLLLYLDAIHLFDWMRNKTIIHFAPERHLWRRIAATKPIRHLACDLFPRLPDVQKVDITQMEFDSSSIDLLIANHVLEHVEDDKLAMSEIVRVLKPGGFALLQTPYSRKLKVTWSDTGISDDLARLEAYGQEDHVRLYGSDILERIQASGLLSEVKTHRELLPGVDAHEMGVNADEPLFLFRKPL